MPVQGRDGNLDRLADNFREEGTFQKHLGHQEGQSRKGKLHKQKHAGGQVHGMCDLEFALGSGKSLKASKQGCNMVRYWF